MALFTLQGTVRDSTGNVTTASINVTVNPDVAPLTLTPTALAFGSQAVGTTSPILSAVLTNVSTARVLFTGGSSMSGSADFHYITDSCAGGGLNAGASCTLQYTFAPTTAGAKTGANLIQYNDGTVKTIPLPFTGTGVTITPPPATSGVVDPTLLPIANKQAPNNSVYNAMNMASQPAGFSYNDPVTGAKIWKATSSTIPTSNTGAGHDYADGSNEASRGWGTNGNTHTILVRGDGIPYYLVDFTRGSGFTNYRRLTVQPIRDLSASFSSVVGQERILYILTNTQLVRYNTATMQVENTGRFPLTVSAFGWLHQDKNDGWFTGLLADNQTIWAWNSQSGQFLTHFESWTNEGRLERDGRYIAVSNGNTQFMLWDLSNNTFGPVQFDASYWLAHNANMRGFWATSNVYDANPAHFDIYTPIGSQIVRTKLPNSASAGYGIHHAGNWLQTDTELGGNLSRQWAFVGTWDNTSITVNATVQQGLGVYRCDGSDTRLLCHTYDPAPHDNSSNYYSVEFVKPSPDGKIVIFNSNMNNSGRYDLFVVEMPLR